MKRHSSAIAALALACALAHSWAHAQWKPTRDVEIVVPFGVGGGADLTARTVARILTEEKIVPVAVTINNRPGGGTSVGIAAVVANRRGDPHTLVLINPQSVITPLQIANSRGWRDLAPVANVMLDDYLLMAHRDAAYKNAAELVAAARAKPANTITVGSAGPADDMAIAVFQAATGVHFKIVRFDGGGQVQNMLLGRHVDLGAGNPLEFLGQIQAGTVRPLGVFRPTRFALMNSVPTMKEQNIDTVPFQMWRGFAMPKDAPADAQAYWQDVMRKVMATKAMQDYIQANMATPHVLVGSGFAAFLEQQESLYKTMLSRLAEGK
jgi:putative tricarboxylic transport membrane protein